MKIHLKKILPVIFAVAGVLILLGIILLAFAAPHASSTMYRVCLILIALCCVLMGIGLLFYIYKSRDRDANFFLYDMKTQRNIPENELTFDRVNSRMGYFMTTLSSSQEQLWTRNVFDEPPAKFGANQVYKPLTAYKMLYDLIETDRPGNWQLFLGAEPKTMYALLDALRLNGEDTMADTLAEAYQRASSREDIDWVRDFVMGNAKYIRRRMMQYIQTNMEWFY